MKHGGLVKAFSALFIQQLVECALNAANGNNIITASLDFVWERIQQRHVTDLVGYVQHLSFKLLDVW